MAPSLRTHPHLYEINARAWLERLSEKYGRRLTLATVPPEEWQAIVGRGFDLVWLMGVWRRSPGARRAALVLPELRKVYDKVLPGWTEADVAGSPYAVYDYSLDPALGKPEELGEVKAKLNALGLGLIVDFVHNHLALDHPWTASDPGRFIQGTAEEAKEHPDWFYQTEQGRWLAHGRDPNFPSWKDTAQVNAFSADLRRALHQEALRIAPLADGFRCDMAMLAINGVFEGIWGRFAGKKAPAEEFWPSLIEKIRRRQPGFLFLAEAYWNTEWQLQRMGFDYTYDKTLYDRLRSSSADHVGGHLRAADVYQRRSARYVENHDEERAAAAFGKEKSMAAAVIMATIPGLRFFHDGQLEGRLVRLPVQLAREPKEISDPAITEFYARLLAAANAPAFHGGQWSLLEKIPAWENNETHLNILAWLWRQAGKTKAIAVNYSAEPAQARLKIPGMDPSEEKSILHDELDGSDYERDVKEVKGQGLYVDLKPWKAHVFDVK